MISDLLQRAFERWFSAYRLVRVKQEGINTRILNRGQKSVYERIKAKRLTKDTSFYSLEADDLQ